MLESEANSNNIDFEEFGDNESSDSECNRLDTVRNFLRTENEIKILNENNTPSQLNTIKETCKCKQLCFSKFLKVL